MHRTGTSITLAVNVAVFIIRGKNTFHSMSISKKNALVKKECIVPDEDFYSSILTDEFRERLVYREKIYVEKCK